jgi:hypothetical protein
MHAIINWDKVEDTWYIEDQNSKFGTLIILSENVVVETEFKEVYYKIFN